MESSASKTGAETGKRGTCSQTSERTPRLKCTVCLKEGVTRLGGAGMAPVPPEHAGRSGVAEGQGVRQVRATVL